MKATHYLGLLLMSVLSFISMYVLMYAMVNSASNVYNSVNQVYMAALMAAPMVVIELAVMGAMYQNRKANAMIVAASLFVGIAAFMFIRQQTAVSDRQFLRSMIPHHGSAILMCTEAPIQDPDIKQLCRRIITGQQEEIDQMKAKLRLLEMQNGR